MKEGGGGGGVVGGAVCGASGCCWKRAGREPHEFRVEKVDSPSPSEASRFLRTEVRET